ncbi:PH domain-containing protein [Trueperella bialowiezensis]|uniref:Bacterial membrane flanked domain n=1 Tax=Trueperella bialowiezensis TaxID=312285 RepID=A0A3S4X6E9_9ACTO|nr:PH domain-containing protein [Trueperella bialowiezensis]VEI13659.1 Bacterial membrane flanked domain [Trueperella bialowiezensis]
MSSRHSRSSQATQLGASVPQQAWRKFHKVTPLSQGGVIWVVLAIVIFNIVMQMFEAGFGDALREIRRITITHLFIGLGALVALTAVVVFFSWIAWRYQSFAIVESGVHKRSGVIFKDHQHMRWDRIQTVEIEQKLFGRIFGFASVKVETAGTEPAMQLGLLTMEDAGNVRREILNGLANARAGIPIGAARGQHVTPEHVSPDQAATQAVYAAAQPAEQPGWQGAGPSPAGQAAPQIPVFDPDDLERDRQIFSLSTGRLIAASMLKVGFIFSVLSLAAIIALAIILDEGGFLFLILAFVSVLWAWAQSLFSEYGTKIFLSANGLRIRSGLTSLITRSIPPQRLHGVVIEQPMLWRRADWWKLDAVLAGEVDLDSDAQAGQARHVVPVGTRSEIVDVLWTMLPSAGTDNDAALLRDALDGTGTGKYFLSAPRRARWFDPITWKSRGVCLTPNVAVFRTGRFRRRVVIVWQDHTQSLRVSQGPIQRRFNLGAIKLDLVRTGVEAAQKNMEIADVERMMWVENNLTAQAREVGISESIEQWRKRVGV